MSLALLRDASFVLEGLEETEKVSCGRNGAVKGVFDQRSLGRSESPPHPGSRARGPLSPQATCLQPAHVCPCSEESCSPVSLCQAGCRQPHGRENAARRASKVRPLSPSCDRMFRGVSSCLADSATLRSPQGPTRVPRRPPLCSSTSDCLPSQWHIGCPSPDTMTPTGGKGDRSFKWNLLIYLYLFHFIFYQPGQPAPEFQASLTTRLPSPLSG